MTDPETIVIQELNKRLKPVQAFGQIPAKRPDAFITVERTGGDTDRFFDSATLAVQTWAKTRVKANQIRQTVSQIIVQIRDLPMVGISQVSSSYHWPDTDSEHERYQILMQIQTQ